MKKNNAIKLFLTSTLIICFVFASFGESQASAASFYVNGKKFETISKIKTKYTIKIAKSEIPWGTGVASAKQVIKFLKSEGFYVVSQKGSHIKLKGPNGKTTIVPSHGNKDLRKGTLNSILKQAGIKIKK